MHRMGIALDVEAASIKEAYRKVYRPELDVRDRG
jgi:hypothetical protein